MPGFEETLDA